MKISQPMFECEFGSPSHTDKDVLSKSTPWSAHFVKSGELFSIDGSRRYFYETSKKLSDFHMAGEEVGKKLKEESQGNYKK